MRARTSTSRRLGSAETAVKQAGAGIAANLPGIGLLTARLCAILARMNAKYIIDASERAICVYVRSGALLFINLPLGLTLLTAVAVGLLYEALGMNGYDAAINFLSAAAYPIMTIVLSLLIGLYLVASLLCWWGYPSNAHRRAEVRKWLMLAVRQFMALLATATPYSWGRRSESVSPADAEGARRDERTPHNDGSHPQLK